jgi:hypothetical protein
VSNRQHLVQVLGQVRQLNPAQAIANMGIESDSSLSLLGKEGSTAT